MTVERTKMWEGIPVDVYSDRVWNSVLAVEGKLSELDSKWTRILQETAAACNILVTDPLLVPYALEKVTLEKAKAAGHPDFITISGPGAVGKGTIRSMIPIDKSTINDTTREPRGEGKTAERDGVQYYFIDEETLNRRHANGEYVYPPVFKPGRGWYAMQKAQIDGLLEARKPFIVEDNITISQELFRYARDQNPAVNPLHLYILPPPPVMGTLAIRLFARAEETNDPRYLREDTIVIPDEMVESTIGARQVEEFLPVVGLIKDGGNVLFLVNDNLKRMEVLVKRISSW